MNITLKRIRHRPETIDGQIWIDGEKVCDCAENASHCLPVGTFPISIIKCKQYSRKMPLICLEDSTSEAVSNPVRSAGITPPTVDSCLEGSTLCADCPKLPFVSNNTSLPKYCPMIKPGNGVHNRLDGSIIVGRYLAPGCLSHPKQAFDALYERIRKNIERGNPVSITITSI